MKTLLVIAMIPCIAYATCQSAYEAAYTSPELYDYADFEAVESCARDAGCAHHAVQAGISAECLEVKYPLDEHEYEACYQKLVNLDPTGDKAKALETCMSDMQCEQAAKQCWDAY